MKSVYSLLMMKISIAPEFEDLSLCVSCESLCRRKISFWCPGSHSVGGGGGGHESSAESADSWPAGSTRAWAVGEGDEALLPSGAYRLVIKDKHQGQDTSVLVRTTRKGRDVGAGCRLTQAPGLHPAPRTPPRLPQMAVPHSCSSWCRPAPGRGMTWAKAPGQGEPGSTRAQCD